MTMYKRILVLALLCVLICFSSCSSKKRTVSYNYGDNIILPDTERAYSEKVSYDEYLKRNYEMQPESAKKLIRDNKKRSKKDTPLRPRKKSWFNIFKKDRSCSNATDAVINDGVRDIK